MPATSAAVGACRAGGLGGGVNFKALNPQTERQKIRFGTWFFAWNPATQSEVWRVELPDLGGGPYTELFT